MRFVLTRDAREFAASAQGFLEGRIECNVQATVLVSALEGGYAERAPLFGWGLGPDGEVAFAALRTPPWPLLPSSLEQRDVPALVSRWLAEDPQLPGVSGVPAIARAIAAEWSAITGGRTRRSLAEAMHVLEQVSEPVHPAPGRLRAADASDRSLMIEWLEAFEIEAGVLAGQAQTMVDSRMASGRLLVWDDGGPVSVLGTNPPVAGVVRVGPVYTPPEHRRKGYAGSAVAAASRYALAAGATSCMLFTDLANPTSNKIYAEVGYQRVGDWEEYLFERL